MSKLNQRKNFIINAVYWAIIIGLILLTTNYLFGLIWPFLLAFLFSWMLRPLIRLLTNHCHFRHSIAVAFSLVAFFGIAGGILVVVTLNIVSWIQQLVVWLPDLYTDTILPAMQTLVDNIQQFVARLDPNALNIVQSIFENAINSISSSVSKFSLQAVRFISGQLTQVPGRFVSFILCIIATIFFTADFNHITGFILRQLPDRTRTLVIKAKETFFHVLRHYGKSYGIIMLVTFIELLIGLLLLRQPHAVLIAALIAIVDIFPIVGAGLILIPWAIISLLIGSTGTGLGLLALYIFMTVVRQALEPRVVGHQVGLHPLVTLVSMFVGGKLFGAFGFFGCPIACAILKSLDDAGVINIIRKEEAASCPHAESSLGDEK